MKLAITLGGILFVTLVAIFFSVNALTKGSSFFSTPMKNESVKVLGWIPFWDQQNAFDCISSHTKSFDFISVFWYRIDADGNLSKYENAVEDQKIIDYAHQNNVKVLMLVANLPDHQENVNNWDHKRVDKVIATADARKKHIEDLMRVMEEKNFDGIDIDYEALKREQRENFSLFIEELANEVHKKGKILGVAIHPKTGEFKPQEDNGSHAQDLQRISKAADQLYFMTYLEHGAFSQPGPLGSIGWMESVLRYALEQNNVPPEKVFMGVGLMGTEWKMKEDGTYEPAKGELRYEDILALTQQKQIQPQWDDASRTPFFQYEDSSGKYVSWFENVYSIEQRFALAEKLGLGGVALWRLGGEDSQIWSRLDQIQQES